MAASAREKESLARVGLNTLLRPAALSGSSLERRDPSVSAIALIAAARALVSALEKRPFFPFEARGDGSLRSQGRPAERLCEATIVSVHAEVGHMR